MTMETPESVVADYLARLRKAATRLPEEDAHDLFIDMSEHLDAAIRPGASVAEIRNVLDRLGPPEALIPAAEGANERKWVETGALIGLVAAEVLFILLPIAIIAWLVGVVLLAYSSVWTLREKVIGFLALGSGFMAAWIVVVASLRVAGPTCSEVITGSVATSPQREPLELPISSCADQGMTWVNYLAIALTLGYVAFQIYALWLLIRAVRKHRHQPRDQFA